MSRLDVYDVILKSVHHGGSHCYPPAVIAHDIHVTCRPSLYRFYLIDMTLDGLTPNGIQH